jgi:CBS domain-containing protein
MICPNCELDNIAGADECSNCGLPLAPLDGPLTDLEISIVSRPVASVPSKSPITVGAAVTARSAIARMNAEKIGCLLVEDGGSIVGIFTERDVLNRITGNLAALDRPVSEVMTASPEIIHEDDSVAYALHAMSVNGYRHLPIADDSGNAVGLLSARDLLRLFAEQFADVSAN